MNDERQGNGLSLTDLRKLHNKMPGWVITLLIVIVAGVIAYHIAQLLIILIIAAVIAYILSSAVGRFEMMGIKRNVAVVLLFVLGAALIFSADIIFVPYLKQEIRKSYDRLPEFAMQLEDTISSSARNYPTAGPVIRKLADAAIGPGGFIEKALDVSAILTQATPFIMGLILVPFFVFFLLKDWPMVARRIMDWIPPSYVETTISVVAEINILVGKYLRGLAADCFFVGVLASCGLWLIGINYPIMLGILSGIANVIPYLGPIVGCLASGFVALMQFRSFDAVLNVILLYIFIKVADDLFIQPMVIGKSVKLHPAPLVITIIAGEKLFGISGMIFGVPVVTAAQKTAGILLERRRETLRREAGQDAVCHRPERSPVRPI